MESEFELEELLELELQLELEQQNNQNRNETEEEDDVPLQVISTGRDISTNEKIKDIAAPSVNHLKLLRQSFGHNSFRPFQWQIIHSVMEKKQDNCIVMATGYGKSLCYQYPAVFKNGLSIVISPLISLMEDQVHSLEVANIPACFLGTAQSKKSQTINELMDGAYRLVYLTPEYVNGDYGFELLQKLNNAVNITLLAIDEAHCVSKWGHDFRPAYRGLGKLRDVLPNVPILAVTATATVKVQDDIIASLKLRRPQTLFTGFDRPNLYFKVEKKSANPYADISRVINNEKKMFDISNGSVIVYCLTKKSTEEITDLLKRNGLKAEAYHAGLNVNTRNKVHNLFIKDEIKIVVATIAFGMGIDKPNVRCVIHYGASSDMEGYYQEAGRAGRDGNPSLCILFHSPIDFTIHRILRDKGNMSGFVRTNKETLNTVMKHYVSSRECRRFLIMSHFDKNLKPNLQASVNCCDNCMRILATPDDSLKYEGLNSDGMYDFSDDVEKFLKVIEYVHPRTFGVGMLISLLRGSKAKKIDPSYFRSDIFGSGLPKTEPWWKAVAMILETENYICKENISSSTYQYSVCVMDRKGKKWLRDRMNSKADPILLKPTNEIIQCLKLKKIKPLYTNEGSASSGNIDNTSTANQLEIANSFNTTDVIQFNQQEQDLSKILFELRHSLAKQQNIIPHVVASDIALHQLALRQPKTLSQLIHVDGMSDTKIKKFGLHFINRIKEYCSKHPQVLRTAKEILSSSSSAFNIVPTVTQMLTIDLYNTGKSPNDIATERKLAMSTILTHLSCAVRSDSIDVSKLITASKLNCVIKIIQADPIKNDMSKLGPIKNICPPIVSYDDIKLTIAYLEARNHLNSLHIPYKDDHALKIDNSNVMYQSLDVYPDYDESELVVEPDCSSVNESSVAEKISSPPITNDVINEKPKNNVNSSTDDKLWDDVDDDIFCDNINEIEDLLNSSQSSTDKNCKSSQKTQNVQEETVKAVSTEKLGESSKAQNVQNETVKTVSTKKPSNDKLLLKKKTVFLDSDTDDDETDYGLGLKRKLPNWMSNTAAAKNVMKAKMSKNSLFN